MTRRVVFAGGVQTRALAKAYRLDIAADRDEDVFFIGAEAIGREAAHRVISAADIVVTDLTSTSQTVPEHLIPANAERVAVPVVTAPFLWPYAGRPHPRNKPIAGLPGGPYPADFGDSFLDSMMAEGVAEDEAVARYLALDIAASAGLDTLLEGVLAELARLDAQAGFDFAGFVHDQFRVQNLFATTERLRLVLLRHVAGEVFSRMGVERLRADALMDAPFLPGAMPIHPGVLAHFGMAAPLPDHRYPVLDEGTFTFEQYCRRYLRTEWNEALQRGLALAETNPAEAVPLLRQALDVSPGSRAGQQALEDAERAVAESTKAPPLALGDGAAGDAPSAHGAPDTPDTPIYAAVDAPMPDSKATSALMPGSLPKQPHPPAPSGPAAPVFSPSGLGRVPFTSETAPQPEPGRREGMFGKPAAGVPTDHDAAEPGPAGEEAPEQQAYVELPRGFGQAEPAIAAAPRAVGNRYVPLPPAEELIEVLPRMLPSTRGLADGSSPPFSAMPETMPPPPLRPVLPPELRPEATDERRGLVARLFGSGKK